MLNIGGDICQKIAVARLTPLAFPFGVAVACLLLVRYIDLELLHLHTIFAFIETQILSLTK